MNKKILLIICGVIIFAAGAGAGIIFQWEQTLKQQAYVSQFLAYQKSVQQDSKMATLLKVVSSKVVPLRASGTVTKIDGMNITLNSSGDNLIIPISSTAKFISFIGLTNTVGGNNHQTVELKDIKVGDHLDINLNLSSENKMEGQAVYISSPATGGKVTVP